jgi:hypothetical protein
MATPLGGISRRRFLAGSGGLALLGACGSGTKSGTGSGGNRNGDGASPFTLVEFFPSEALRPGSPQRLPVSLANPDGSFVDRMPAELTFQVTPDGSQEAISTTTVPSHSAGLPRAYLPLVFTPPVAGIYDIATTVDGKALTSTIQVPATSEVPAPGQPMIPVDTPTMANPRGVELVCSADPPCPLHDVTLTEALASGQPVAWLVSTPRFCQQAICGPVLDLLLAQRAAFPGIKMLHSEVYVSVAAAQGQLGQSPAADPATALQEAVRRYALTYEPVLFLAMPGGAISERLDVIYDETELLGALHRLLG